MIAQTSRSMRLNKLAMLLDATGGACVAPRLPLLQLVSRGRTYHNPRKLYSSTSISSFSSSSSSNNINISSSNVPPPPPPPSKPLATPIHTTNIISSSLFSSKTNSSNHSSNNSNINSKNAISIPYGKESNHSSISVTSNMVLLSGLSRFAGKVEVEKLLSGGDAITTATLVTQTIKKDTLFPTGDWILQFSSSQEAQQFERKIYSISSGSSSNSVSNSNSLTSSSSALSNPTQSQSQQLLKTKYIDANFFDYWYTTHKLKLNNKTILFGNLSEKITVNELCLIFDGYHLAENPFRKLNKPVGGWRTPKAFFVTFATVKEAQRAAAEKSTPIEGVRPIIHWYNC